MASSDTAGLASAETPTASRPKLHGRAFYESIGSPRYVVAPMVDQSEFAWRMLTRSFLTPEENYRVLAYTPMFHARLFEETAKYRDTHFQATRLSPTSPAETIPFLDGNPSLDRPLFVQFCANDPAHLLGAARLAAPYCDAVDLNLGCPQGIARKGHYGAFLQEDQELIYKLINTLHKNLPIPVTAKIRILDTKEETLAYARNVLAAGASIITVHGRRREQKGHLTGLADWDYIRYLRDNLPPETVIFANGNILQRGDLERCLEATGADAVMSAEGNLSNPALFARPPPPGQEGREYWRGRDGKGGWRVDAVFRRYLDILHRYALQRDPPARRPLFVVGDDEAWLRERQDGGEKEGGEEGPARKKRKKDGGAGGGGGGGGKQERTTSPNLLAVRPHLFHLLRHLVSRHTDIRDALARCQAGDVAAIERVLDMVERRVAGGLVEYERTGGRSVEEPGPEPTAPEAKGEPRNRAIGKEDEDATVSPDPESSVATVRACKRPWWVVQPIVRPLPKEALAKGSIQLSRKELKKQQQQEAAAANGSDGGGGVGGGKAGNNAETNPKEELLKPDGKDGTNEPLAVYEKKRPSVPIDESVAG
ncbi:hypothetical protein DL768_008260 [Monosporascus sp. mg162]|nr:hypothetical protein DL768_008260 [Monosporascus sp. mg162]